VLLDAEIRVDGITYFEVACVASYNTGNNYAHRMENSHIESVRDCIRSLLWRSWLLSPCFFRLPRRWTSPQRAQVAQVLVLRISPHMLASCAAYGEPFLRRWATYMNMNGHTQIPDTAVGQTHVLGLTLPLVRPRPPVPPPSAVPQTYCNTQRWPCEPARAT
jgi:hypothetical protein